MQVMVEPMSAGRRKVTITFQNSGRRSPQWLEVKYESVNDDQICEPNLSAGEYS